MNVTVCETTTELATAAADLIVQKSRENIRERGRFTLVLTGGSTPEPAYVLLSQFERATAIDWPNVYIFISDERMVPMSDPRSNFGMARRSLLDRVPIPQSNLLPMPSEGMSEGEAAEAYEKRLKSFFDGNGPSRAAGGPPRFDLILLGMGDDGHTASLFPGAAALKVDNHWVTSSPPGTLPPPVDRVTLTFPVLNAARHVAFLVSGDNKAKVLREVLEEKPSSEVRPSVGVQPTSGDLTWLVDQAAARLLTTHS